MPRLSLQFLGAFHVTVDGQPAASFRSNRARALLAYLAVERQRAHARASLAADFWPDLPEPEALHNLRQTLVRLRQAIGDEHANPPHMLISRQDVRFNPDGDYALDVCDFESQIASAGPTLTEPRLPLLENAVSLYQGEFLRGFSLPDSYAFDEWLLLKREQFHRRALDALHALANWYLEQGSPEKALIHARRQLELDAWREEAHRQAMLALSLSGQRSAALAQYDACCKTLAAELHVSPETETAALYEAIKAGDISRPSFVPEFVTDPSAHAAPRSKHPIPLTPFIGRTAELDHLLRLFQAPAYRLITLAGEGGMGKTRLAMALAECLDTYFRDGVWFVSLAETGSDFSSRAQAETTLVTSIATTLGLAFYGKGTPKAQLHNFLRQRELLLVLDNFESLLGHKNEGAQMNTEGRGRNPSVYHARSARSSAPNSSLAEDLSVAELVLELLQQSPGLKVLITSRERLNLQAEYLYRLKGLPVPASHDPAARTFSSVQLFVERAERAWDAFALDDATLNEVIRVCQSVDGMPLGIELAAARVDQLAVAEIARCIQDDLDFLASTQLDLPPRHRSLRAVFEGSWRALPPSSQRVLAGCSLFAGSFALPAATAVTGARREDIQSLLDHSLLRPSSPGRYELHALVRQFAAQKLGNQATEYGLRYAEYYTGHLENRIADLCGPRQPQALNEIGQEIENIRQVWRAAALTDLPRLLRLADGLERFYEQRGWYSEGWQMFDLAAKTGKQIAAQCADGKELLCALHSDPHPNHFAGLLIRQAHFDYLLGEFDVASQNLHACLAWVCAEDDPVLYGRCLHLLGCIDSDLGNLPAALEKSHAALALFEQAAANEWIANALTNIGRTLAVQGQYTQANEIYQRGLAIRRQLGAPSGLADSLNNLGLLALRTGDYPAAERYLPEALAFEREMDNQPGAAAILSNLGLVHLERQRYTDARACFQEALDIQARIGDREAIGILHNNLGDVANLLGEYRTAIEHLEASLAIKREMNNRRGQTFSLVHLGHAWFGLGNFERAWDHHHKALRIAIDISLTPLVLAALVGLAQVLVATGQPVRALELLYHPLHHPAGWQRVRSEAQQVSVQAYSTLSLDGGFTVETHVQETDLADLVTAFLAESA